MNAFDKAMNLLDEKFSFIASTKQIVSSTDEENKVRMLSGSELFFNLKFWEWNTDSCSHMSN